MKFEYQTYLNITKAAQHQSLQLNVEPFYIL